MIKYGSNISSSNSNSSSTYRIGSPAKVYLVNDFFDPSKYRGKVCGWGIGYYSTISSFDKVHSHFSFVCTSYRLLIDCVHKLNWVVLHPKMYLFNKKSHSVAKNTLFDCYLSTKSQCFFFIIRREFSIVQSLLVFFYVLEKRNTFKWGSWIGMLYFPKQVCWVNNRRKHCRLSFHFERDEDSTFVLLLLLLGKLTANMHSFMIMLRHIVKGNISKKERKSHFCGDCTWWLLQFVIAN